MRTAARWISRISTVSLAAVLATTVGLRVVHGQAQHVSWDIINIAFTVPPTSNETNPPAQPGALNCEPLKAAIGGR
jgi:hypothetical protein